MSDPADALPVRDPERIAPTRLVRLLTYLVVGAIGAAAGAVLMAIDAGVEGHGHGAGGSSFAMLPHQVLLTAPAAVLVVLMLGDARGPRLAEAMAAACAGILSVDVLLA